MNKAYKFRLYPDAAQRELIAKTFGCCRFIYNKMLADKIAYYEQTGKMLKCYPSQYKEAFPWLREVDSQALCGANIHLKSAYDNFFRDETMGFPHFKAKRGKQSYTTYIIPHKYGGSIRLENGYIILPKLRRVKVKQHRPIPEGWKIKQATVSRTPTGKYFVSVLFEYQADIAPVAPVKLVGLDFSMKQLYVTSDGEQAAYPHFLRQSLDRLAREQRRLSHTVKGGRNWEKQRLRVALLHERIANQRADFLHKASRQIANAYDAVCIEDLNMQGMAQSLNFGKSVHDAGWGLFRSMLAYKLADQGKQLVTVDRWFPSSKTCSSCAAVKEALALSERVYRCDCGFSIDRDLNAAINIRNEGARLLA